MPNGDVAKPSRFQILLNSLPALLCLSIPLVLANSMKGVIAGFLVLAILFFFPGYALLSFLGTPGGGLRILLSPIFGIVALVTLYDFSSRHSAGAYSPYFAAVFSCLGMLIFLRNVKGLKAPGTFKPWDVQACVAGAIVVLAVAPLYWRSGRFSHDEFVFYGPAGQDPLFHVTLLQRLMSHIPPDNFMMAGLRAPVYHYFSDLTLAFILHAQRTLHLGSTDVFDLYYRCYPTLLYFLLGALAFRVGQQLVGKSVGGVLGVMVLLGSGGVGWLLGLVTTVVHVPGLASFRTRFFTEWTTWNGVDGILPLVHRPANYHGLLISLTAIALLLHAQRRREWVAAGLLLGWMAGFNFTLAATFGISAVLGAFVFWVRSQPNHARELTWCAASILIGSLPVLAAMLSSGFRNAAPGFPFRGPNLEFTNSLWAGTLSRALPGAVVPILALLAFVVAAYGIRLVGLGGLLRGDITVNRSLAVLLSLLFLISFGLGTFFPYKALDGVAIIFLQPSLWIIGFFSLIPLAAWFDGQRKRWRSVVLWGVIAIPWIQAMAAFNLGRRVDFSADTADALNAIRASAPREQVIAFLPADLEQKSVLGASGRPTNFAITAMSGLDGYFSTRTYSISYAVPALQGKDDASVLERARQIYEQRRSDVQVFLEGRIDANGSLRLSKDHVCWVVASGDALPLVSRTLTPWRRNPDSVVFKLCP